MLGSNFTIFASGRHDSVSNAENIVKDLKYVLKGSGAWNLFQAAKLNFAQADYLLQIAVNLLNSRPLFIFNRWLISPNLIQSLMHRFSENIELPPKATQQQKARNYGEILNKVETLVMDFYDNVLRHSLPSLLSEKAENEFTHKLGGSHLQITKYCLVFDCGTLKKKQKYTPEYIQSNFCISSMKVGFTIQASL